MKIKSILLIEDDESVKDSISRDFKKPIDDEKIGLFSASIKWTHSEKEAFVFYKENHFDLIILDLRLGEGGDGIDLLEKVRKNDPLTPILVLSGQAEAADHHRIGKYSNIYFFDKNLGAETGTENVRLNRFIECLRDGEKNYERIHRYFYIPPVISSFLFNEKASSTNPFGPGIKPKFIHYLRNPQDGFDEKGIYGWFDQVGVAVSQNTEPIAQELFGRSVEIDMKQIIERIRGNYSLETMENFLNMDSNYREHFSHQFHVFLIGHLIYNVFKDRILPHVKQMFDKYATLHPKNMKKLPELFEITWFLTALFHDCGYPVQYYHELFTHYFRENFQYKFLPRMMVMEDLIVSEGLSYHFDTIADDFWSDENRKEEFKLLMIHRFKERNHAIHSSVALRKLARSNERYTEDFSNLFKPVYSAIAMHDWEIWGNSGPIRDFFDRNKFLKYPFKFNYNLDFLADLKRNPLLHILLIADSIHHWGRGIGIHNLFFMYRIELIAIRQEEDLLTFEMNVREGENRDTSPKTFCLFCQTFKTLSIILGADGLPIKLVLNRGLNRQPNPQTFVEFHLGIGEKIDCIDTNGCPRKENNFK